VHPLDENDNCSRTYATFRVSGDALDPDEVGAVLGLAPTRAFAKGQEVAIDHKAKTTRRQPTGIWLLTTQERVASTSLERHLVHLLEAVEPAAPALARLRAQRGLAVDVFCFWESATGHGGPELSASTLARIAALDAGLGIDFYRSNAGARG
jgi:hypothetical protein